MDSILEQQKQQKQQVALYLGCDISKLSQISRYELDVFLKHIEDDKKNGTIHGSSPEIYHRMVRNRNIPLEERLKALDLKACKILLGYLERGIKAMDVPKPKVSLMTVALPSLKPIHEETDNSCW